MSAENVKGFFNMATAVLREDAQLNTVKEFAKWMVKGQC
jgi:hypothetical protein